MELPQLTGYTIQKEIGRGARGVVYLARQGEASYAVKVQNSPDDRSLLRHGAILACTRHPGLPEVLEVGEIDGRPYLVREYIAGYSLAAELDGGPLPEARIVEIGKTMAGALNEVHRHGLIHRDVKPANILLARSGGVRLIDFGFATRIHAEQHSAVGTYLYSAPEQTGMLTCPMDQRTDLYALGGVLFCCATGHPPYQESDPGELLRLHASAPVPQVREANPDISPALAAIIEKLLCKDPGDRYQTGHSLLTDLRALANLNQRLSDNQPIQLGEHSHELQSGLASMVGRDAELQELLGSLNRSLQNEGQSVLIEGEGGCGKSLLAEEFLKRTARLVPLTLRVTCEADWPPYAPVRKLVNQYFAALAELPLVVRQRIEGELLQQPHDLVKFWSFMSPASRAFFPKSEGSYLQEAGDQFLEATAAFFVVVSRLHGGAVIFLDDAHNVDEGTRQILSRLWARLGKCPLVLVATSRSGPEVRTGLERYVAAAQPQPRLRLGALDNSEVEVLVYAMLGSRPVSPDLTRILAHRSQGNPFAVAEYVRAMLNAGVILPSREGWRFDQASLQQLELPDDVIQLVLRRMDGLEPSTLELLSRAALLGPNFTVAMLATVEKCPERRVRDQLEGAARANVVENVEGDTYLFVHDRLRQAFLGRLNEAQQSQGHRLIAQGLEGLVAARPELRYALARHYALGENEEVRDRVYESNLDAGAIAMREFAYEDAYGFLSQAGRTCAQDRLEWMEPLSVACEHTHRTEEAIRLLEVMLGYNQAPLHQAQRLVRLSKLRTSKLDRTGARDECRKALAVIGRGVLDHPLWNGFAAAFCMGRWALSEWLGWGRGACHGEQRELHRALASLYRTYGEGEYFDMHYAKMFEMSSRACLASFRLGPSPQMVTSYSNLLVFIGLLRKPHWCENWAQRVEKVAQELGDPISLAYFEVARCISLHMAGLSEEVDRRQEEILTQRSHVLEAWAFLTGVTDLSFSLFMRGHVRKAWSWVQKGLERCRLTSSPVGVARDQDILSCYAISCLAVLGQSGEALSYVERLQEKCRSEHTDRSLRTNFFGHLLSLHLETRELGLPMEETGREFLRFKLPPSLVPLHRRHFYVLWCYCWLERCYKSEGAASELAGLDEALELLRKTANRPVLKGHFMVAQAGRLYLGNQPELALKTLSSAQEVADLHDAPWISYEVARVKSRVLTRLRKFDVAAREAERAYHLALEFGWSSRARAVAREFSLARSSRSLSSTSMELGVVKPSPEDTLRIRLERQLDSLLHLSLASSQLVGPKDQTRVVLDELIRLLSAERAFVFLANPSGLFFFTGRDSQGNTLEEPTNYSQTVVEMVRTRREPLIIAGTEQGEVLGSKSVIDHNLRSIICAPLSVREEFAGVIYLDNRLARGVFSEEDVGILQAVSNHISVGIETARAARLEVEVESERRQRALADVLSEFTMSLSSTLEPDTIVQSLLETLSRAVHFVRATVWMGTPEALGLVAQHGYPESLAAGTVIVAAEHHGFDRACESKRPVIDTCKARDPVSAAVPISQPFSWLAVPLLSDRRVAGVVTLSADRIDAYSEAEVEVAFTFCNQAGIALANAHLFKEINRLATTDSLTGCYNRRRFFQIGERELERSRRESLPLSVIMTDVDHFKKFNDEHGHAGGDEVLRRVAQVCREGLGEFGTLGRYGGEEFAAVLTGFEGVAARSVAERLRVAIESQRVQFEGKSLQVTLSLGVAQLQPHESLEQVLARADECLYEAKRQGRNRAILAPEG